MQQHCYTEDVFNSLNCAKTFHHLEWNKRTKRKQNQSCMYSTKYKLKPKRMHRRVWALSSLYQQEVNGWWHRILLVHTPLPNDKWRWRYGLPLLRAFTRSKCVCRNSYIHYRGKHVVVIFYVLLICQWTHRFNPVQLGSLTDTTYKNDFYRIFTYNGVTL